MLLRFEKIHFLLKKKQPVLTLVSRATSGVHCNTIVVPYILWKFQGNRQRGTFYNLSKPKPKCLSPTEAGLKSMITSSGISFKKIIRYHISESVRLKNS